MAQPNQSVSELDTAPSTEPVTLAEVKANSRIDISDDDTLITALITAARQWLENYYRITLIETTYKQRMDNFPTNSCNGECDPSYKNNSIELLEWPLLAITSIQYVDSDGATQTFNSSNYIEEAHTRPCQVVLAYDTEWPDVRKWYNAVTVTYTAGFGSLASDVPQAIKQACLMLIGHWYENRETVMVGQTSKEVEFAVNALMEPYKRTEQA